MRIMIKFNNNTIIIIIKSMVMRVVMITIMMMIGLVTLIKIIENEEIFTIV